MKGAFTVLRQVLEIGDLQDDHWTRELLIHVQNSMDMKIDDVIIGKN